MDYYQNIDYELIILPMWNMIRESLNAIYVGDPFYTGTKEPWCATNLEYNGLWGDKTIHSISMQTAYMGIPVLQIETMLDVRS